METEDGKMRSALRRRRGDYLSSPHTRGIERESVEHLHQKTACGGSAKNGTKKDRYVQLGRHKRSKETR